MPPEPRPRLHQQHRGEVPPRPRDRGRRGHHDRVPVPRARRAAAHCAHTTPVSGQMKLEK